MITTSSRPHTPVAESGPVSVISGWCTLWLVSIDSSAMAPVRNSTIAGPAGQLGRPAPVRGGGVLGEEPAELGPPLGVDQAHVPVLELVDLLDLHEVVGRQRAGVMRPSSSASSDGVRWVPTLPDEAAPSSRVAGRNPTTMTVGSPSYRAGCRDRSPPRCASAHAFAGLRPPATAGALCPALALAIFEVVGTIGASQGHPRRGTSTRSPSCSCWPRRWRSSGGAAPEVALGVAFASAMAYLALDYPKGPIFLGLIAAYVNAVVMGGVACRRRPRRGLRARGLGDARCSTTAVARLERRWCWAPGSWCSDRPAS